MKNPPPENPVGGVFVSKSIKRTATIEVDGSVGSAIGLSTAIQGSQYFTDRMGRQYSNRRGSIDYIFRW